MDAISVREPDNGGAAVDRLARGESLVVTRDGAEVAELTPRSRRGPGPAELLARWRTLPDVDPEQLRREIDAIIDQSRDRPD